MGLAYKEAIQRLRGQLLQYLAIKVHGDRDLESKGVAMQHAAIDLPDAVSREGFLRTHAIAALDVLAEGKKLSGQFVAVVAHFLKKPNFEKAILELDVPLYKHLGIASETMEEVFQIGRHFFEKGETVKARDIFLLLTLLDNISATAFLSLGIAEQVLKEYQAAIHAYTITSLIHRNDPIPHLYMAECFALLKRWDEAEKGVDRAERFMEIYHQPSHRAHAEALRDYINKRKS